MKRKRISFLVSGVLLLIAVFASTAGAGDNAWTTQGPAGEIVQAIVSDPNGILYAGTSGGGVFKSTNGGGSWTAMNSDLANTNVKALAIDPTNSNVLVAGTADGVFTSSDAGVTWIEISTGLTDTNIRALAINPITGADLYAGTSDFGVFKISTGDPAWSAVNTGLTTSAIRALAIDPITPSTIYAGTFGGGIFKSTDSAANWFSATNGAPDGVLALAIHPSTTSTLYVGTSGGALGGVFKSTNGGTDWNAVNNPGLTAQQINAVGIDSNNPNTVYAGSNANGVFRTLDGGDNWTAVNTDLTELSVNALVLDPTDTQTVFAGTDNGVFDITFAEADIDVSPLDIPFGVFPVGINSGANTVTIENTGNLALTIESISDPGGDFSTNVGFGFPQEVNVGGSVSFTVEYLPTDVGTDTVTIDIVSTDPDEATVSVTLTGEGIIAPDIDVTPLSVEFGNHDVGTISGTEDITIENTGADSLHITGISTPGGEFTRTVAFDFPLGLDIGETALFTVEYSPTDVGTDSATVDITSDDPDEGTVTVILAGTGTAPEIEVNAVTIGFGRILVNNTSDPFQVIIQNLGNDILEVTEISILSGPEFSLSSRPPLPVEIQGGGEVTFNVQYNPVDVGVDDTATITISSNDSDEDPTLIGLSGEGFQVPEIDVTPPSLEFGKVQVLVGVSDVQNVTIENTGDADLIISNISISAEFSFTTSLPSVVAPDQNKVFGVRYNPINTGVDNGTIVISSDDPDEPTVTVSLMGEGVIEEDINVTPTVVPFGVVVAGESSGLVNIIIDNVGSSSLTINEISDPGGEFSLSNVPALPASVPASESINFDVEYNPIDSNVDNAIVTISSSDPDEGTLIVNLSGEGIFVPDIQVSPLNFDFGEINVDAISGTVSIIMQNNGGADLEITAINEVPDVSEFVLTLPDLPAIVGPGQTTTFDVQYRPTNEGVDNLIVDIVSDDPDQPTVTVNLAGEGVIEPRIEVTPQVVEFGGVQVGATGGPETVTIQNTGNANLTLDDISDPGGVFSLTNLPNLANPIGPGQSVTVDVLYDPILNTIDNASFVITHDDPDRGPVTVNVEGTGLAPSIDVDPPAVPFGGVQVGKTGGPVTLTVSNTGNADLNVSEISSPGGEFSLANVPSLTVTIPPGENATFDVLYKPTDVIDDNASINIRSNHLNTDDITTVDLSGSGLPVSAIEIVPTVLNFDTVGVGDQTAPKNFVIRNTGTAVLNITNISAPSAEFSFEGGLPGPAINIAPGNEISIGVRYQPADVGADNSLIGITSNDPDAPQVSVNVSGVGELQPNINLPSTTVDFEVVSVGTTTDPKSVTIQNTGQANLIVTGISEPGGVFAINNLPTFSAVVAPGGNVVFNVRYTPTTTDGDTATVNIDSDDPDEPSVSVGLRGLGAFAPDIDVSPLVVPFGEVFVDNTGGPVRITVKNVGNDVLNVNAIEIGGGGVFAIANPLGPNTLIAPGDSVEFDVTYEPVDDVQDAATIDISSDDPDEAIVSVDLSGQGIIASVIVVDPPSVDYGVVEVGKSSPPAGITLQNNGNEVLTISGVGSPGGEFSLLNLPPIPFNVNAGAQVTFDAQYSPTNFGTDDATVTITSSDPVNGFITIPLTGEGAQIQDIEVSPASLDIDFGVVDIGAIGGPELVTISNEGTRVLVINSIQDPGGEFSFVNLPAIPRSISPGENMQFGVQYSPTNTDQDSASFQIASDDPDEGIITVDLHGEGRFVDHDPPIAIDDVAAVPANTPTAIDVLSNDDTNGGVLDPTSVQILFGPFNGTVSLDPLTGLINYTPEPTFVVGNDLFRYSVDNTLGKTSNTASVTVTIDTPPQANNDTTATEEDVPVDIDVTANDTDFGGAIVANTVAIVSQPPNGSVALANGIATYTPALDFFGSDTFTYTVDDNGGLTSNEASVTVEIQRINDPPVAVNDTLSLQEDTPTEIEVTANDSDDDVIDLTSVFIPIPPNNGQVSVDPTTGVVTYTPTLNFSGEDSFEYNMRDSDGVVSNNARVFLTVIEANDPPVAVDDEVSTPEEQELVVDVTANDSDVDGALQVSTVSITGPPNHGTAQVNVVTGAITYTPETNFFGPDTVEYKI